MAAWWALDATVAGGAGGGAAVALLRVLPASAGSWTALGAATCLSCLLEAVTTQLDNIFVPLHYFALLCLL